VQATSDEKKVLAFVEENCTCGRLFRKDVENLAQFLSRESGAGHQGADQLLTALNMNGFMSFGHA